MTPAEMRDRCAAVAASLDRHSFADVAAAIRALPVDGPAMPAPGSRHLLRGVPVEVVADPDAAAVMVQRVGETDKRARWFAPAGELREMPANPGRTCDRPPNAEPSPEEMAEALADGVGDEALAVFMSGCIVAIRAERARASAEMAEARRDAQEETERLRALYESECGHTLALASELTMLQRERDGVQRTLERFVHGEQIEGDYVCPDSLLMTALESELARVREANATHIETCSRLLAERVAALQRGDDAISEVKRLRALLQSWAHGGRPLEGTLDAIVRVSP